MAWYNDLFDWGADNAGSLIEAGTGLFGQYLNSGASSDAADAQMNIANTAAEMSKFTPYGVTTGFGSSWFDTEKQQAGYELDPVLGAYRDSLFKMGAQSMPQTMDIQDRADEYYGDIQGMLAPQRAQEQAQLQQNMFGSGRLGMRLAGEGAGTGGGGMVQPDIFGYTKAQELANQNLAMQARQQATNELDAGIARGTGLWQQGFGVEQLGMPSLELGSQMGGRAATAGASGASQLLQGGLAAAQSNLDASVGWGNTIADAGLQFGGMFGNQG